jgi:nifR3 family TIM-barrel protein
MNFDYVLGSSAQSTTAVPVVLAPLSGVSDVVFRRIAKRWGADFVVTEMVPANELIRGSEEARLRAEGVGISPHVVQLVGRNPDSMGEATRLAEAAGADVIDVNLGCPAKSVTGGLAGSALMREPDLALRIIEAVASAATVPVTVKMRLGWDHASLNAADIAQRAVALGLRAVVVHGRTRQQFYKGRADWAAIAPVVQAVRAPVIANGDITSLAEARACLAASGAAGLMIGRAAVGQPWIVGAISSLLRGVQPKSPSCADRTAIAIEHYEGLLALYGREMGRRHARKHLAAYADRAREDGYRVSNPDRLAIVTSEDPHDVVRRLSCLFGEREKRAA